MPIFLANLDPFASSEMASFDGNFDDNDFLLGVFENGSQEGLKNSYRHESNPKIAENESDNTSQSQLKKARLPKSGQGLTTYQTKRFDHGSGGSSVTTTSTHSSSIQKSERSGSINSSKQSKVSSPTTLSSRQQVTFAPADSPLKKKKFNSQSSTLNLQDVKVIQQEVSKNRRR